MRRRWIAGGALAIAGLAGIVVAQNATVAPDAPIVAEAPGAAKAPAPRGLSRAATPMAERVAVLGILNKRNGLARDLRMRPGDRVRIGDAVVRLSACDQTEPWEKDQLTGAFVQLIVLGSDQKWRKVFSGWLYKESPSLNVVEHPVYDVWVKACKMRHPEAGSDTVVISDTASGEPRASRSKAKKSPALESAPSEDTAPSSNSI
jgi:hypothetical protein